MGIILEFRSGITMNVQATPARKGLVKKDIALSYTLIDAEVEHVLSQPKLSSGNTVDDISMMSHEANLDIFKKNEILLGILRMPLNPILENRKNAGYLFSNLKMGTQFQFASLYWRDDLAYTGVNRSVSEIVMTIGPQESPEAICDLPQEICFFSRGKSITARFNSNNLCYDLFNGDRVIGIIDMTGGEECFGLWRMYNGRLNLDRLEGVISRMEYLLKEK